MKKFLCLIIIFAMFLPCIGVYADSVASKDMQQVLLLVKSKVDIPEELSKFTPRTMENPENGKVTYSFMWEKEDGSFYIEVSCDEKGRINNYYAYDNNAKSSKKLTTLTPEDIIKYAGAFLKKTTPEIFNTDDTMEYSADSLYVNNLNYTLTFSRMYEGTEVKNNNATIRLSVFDDEIFVRSMSLSYDYEAMFDKNRDTAEDYNEKYTDSFPVELIYTDEYSYNKEEKKTALVYRRKNSEEGYILASTGEKAEEDLNDGMLYRNGAMKEMASDSVAMGGVQLTKEEIAGLQTVEGVLSQDKIRSLLKKLPYVKLVDSLICNSFDIYVNDNKSVVSVVYSSKDGKRYISASLDGASGDIINFYNSSEYNGEVKITESKKKSGYASIDKFLSAAIPDKLAELYAIPDESEHSGRLTRRYDRQVNGIRYINDGVNITYDISGGIVTNFNVDFEDERVFADPNGCVDIQKGTEALFESAPLKKIYIKSGGDYKLCYTVSQYGVNIDALTGKVYKPYGQSENKKYSYADLEGHWAKEKIIKLAEAQIGFEGEAFRPDEDITLYDLLRLFAAATRGKYYLDYSEDELYKMLENEEILIEGRKKETVTREDAFVYMVRFDGLEKVAKLSEIFRVTYADAKLITQDKIGYPAILTGLGIICGNGGKLRPSENITRAEAAIMAYNYMMRDN